jgi:hypothetical protein
MVCLKSLQPRATRDWRDLLDESDWNSSFYTARLPCLTRLSRPHN